MSVAHPGRRYTRWVSTGAATARPALARRRAIPGAALLEREAPLVALLAFYVVLMAVVLPHTLVQDSWFTLVTGREIFEHGLPHSNQLTVWSHGDHWVDQQWLAQASFYGLERIGGIRLVLLVHGLLMTTGFVVSLVAARARGASNRSVVIVAAVCLLLAPWGLQMRAQAFAPLLFAAVLWLLVSDSRAPGRRVLWVLPILVLWANLHGTVVLGAILVALRGLTSLSERRGRVRAGAPARTREALVLLAAPLCVLASPYGSELVAYYHQMLDSPLFRDYVVEWQTSKPSGYTSIFYVIAFAAVALVARQARHVTRFEFLALALLTVSAVTAIRSIVWFGLAATIILPVLLDSEFPQRPPRRETAYRSIAKVAGTLAIVGATAFTVSRPASWFVQDWPNGALGPVSRQLARPDARIFADDRTADWLLWKLPRARGRIALDIRYELLSKPQFEDLVAYRHQSGAQWRRAANGYATIVLDPHGLAVQDLRRYGATLYDDGMTAVLRNPDRG
jgi:hypothetical protein